MYGVSCLVLALVCAQAYSKPVEDLIDNNELTALHPLRLQKRFINPSLTLGEFSGPGVQKIRTKRSEDECEKLQLCKLHARSQRNFMSAFELYFVNRENARMWDHHARSMAECEERFGDC